MTSMFIPPDDDADDLRRLEEVLDRLKQSVAVERARLNQQIASAPSLSSLMMIYRARDRAFLGLDIFGDPSWSIMLELFAAWHRDRKLSTSAVCTAGDAAATTGLRHLQRLIGHGLIERHPDTQDARRSYIGFTPEGLSRMRAIFDRTE